MIFGLKHFYSSNSQKFTVALKVLDMKAQNLEFCMNSMVKLKCFSLTNSEILQTTELLII